MPERTCVCCRKKREKKDFFRISEFEGKYVFDKKMNVQSRGFYVCKDIKCVERLSKHKKYNIDIQYLLQMLEEFNVDILFVEKKKAFLEIFSRDLNVVGIFNKKVINGILSKVEVTTGEST